MSSRKSKSSSRRHEAADEWKRYTSPEGHVYYYNAATKESRWERPLADVSASAEPKEGPKSRNSKFQSLKSSLEGRLNSTLMGMTQDRPVIDVKRSLEQQEVKPSPEEQYEAETAGMGAAERLRFLRKKRQESMMAKKNSSAGDDFMAEVTNNMKKKGVSVLKENLIDKQRQTSWKEKQLKNQVTDKERMQENTETKQEIIECEVSTKPANEHVVQSHLMQEVSEPSSPERVVNRRRSPQQKDEKLRSSVQDFKEVKSVEHDHPPPEKHSVEAVESRNEPSSGDPSPVPSSPILVQNENEPIHDEGQASKKREKLQEEAQSRSNSPRQLSGETTELKEEPSSRSIRNKEAEAEARAKDKQLRRERRRIAKLEAALAAQKLSNESQESQNKPSEMNQNVSNAYNSYIPGGQVQMPHGQPPFSGGMYPPYPYTMMPPVSSPCGYYYPYMQPPPASLPMYPPGMTSPGYQLVPTPPSSSEGMAVPSALVPYGGPFSNGYVYDITMYNQLPAPELSQCDCCKGIGVDLVEKNGVCAHCNRLRLAFIVDSAQMRQRCSVCGGWGFQLLQLNGMCKHCCRQTTKKALASKAVAPRRSVIAASTTAMSSTRLRSNSSVDNNSDDIDWDKSSLEDSDWDD